MTKEEAAKFLGISVRSLERYTHDNRIGVRYERGRTRQTPVYDEAEIERFKAELARIVHRPAVRLMPPYGDSTAAELATMAPPDTMQAPDLLMRLLAAVQQNAPAAANRPAVEIRDKLTLSIVEAAALSGYSQAAIRKAVAAGVLPVQRISGRVRIRRRDLEAFVEGTP